MRQENHEVLKQFNIRFENFNSATSYSGPAALRLLKSVCGQPSHEDLYERLFLLPFDEVKDIFEKTITLQVMTEDRNRMISVDGGSHYRYPSIDAQSAEITITKVQLGYI